MPIYSVIKSGIGFAFYIAVSAMAFAQTEPEVNVNSPELQKAYQQVLYEYYQGNFAKGLTQFSILEQRYPNGLANISDSLRAEIIEPELLKGAMSLAYGLNNQASDIFTRLLKDKPTDKVSAFAWLLLGETYHDNGNFVQAVQSFSNISMEQANTFFDTDTRDHWLYLQAQLHGFLINKNKATVVGNADSDWLTDLSDDSIYRQYIAYNQALGLLQNEEVERAIVELDRLASAGTGVIERWGSWINPLYQKEQASFEADERAAIRDRANLTLGFTLMQQDKPHQAYRTFEKIRTSGLDYNNALLGFGWAAAEKGDWQVALAIWQKLIEMPEHSEFTLEAYIASAYAYEKAFAPMQAMNMLQLGVSRFKQASDVLELALEQVSEPQFILDLVPSVLTLDPQTDSYTLLREQGKNLDAQFIFESISVSNEFKTAIEALQSSLEIRSQLLSWKQRMSQYHLMLDERKVERSARAASMSANRTLDTLASLKLKRDQLADTLQQAEDSQEGSVFMSAQYQDWLTRVKRAQQGLQTIAKLKTKLQQKPLAESYTKRLDLVAGRLTWIASEALPVKMWQAKKALANLDKDLIAADKRQQGLLTQLATQPLYAEQWQRVDTLNKRLSTQLKNNQALQQTLVTQLSGLFKKAIIEHSAKVKNYLLQAQLATVRLSDQALQKDESDLIKQGQDLKDNAQ